MHTGNYCVDFREVRGQVSAKRALEIASAGAHNILLIGPTGVRQDDAGEATANNPAASGI